MKYWIAIALFSILVCGSAHGASTFTILKPPAASPHYLVSGMGLLTDGILTRDLSYGPGGACQVENASSVWTNLHMPSPIVEQKCLGGTEGYTPDTVVAGEWRSSTGNWRAFFGTISASVEVPPLTGASADFSAATDTRQGANGKVIVSGHGLQSDGRRVGWTFDGTTITNLGCPGTGCIFSRLNALSGDNWPVTTDLRGAGQVGFGTNGWTRAYVWDAFFWRALPQVEVGDAQMSALDINGDYNATVGFSGASTAGGPATPIAPAIWLGGHANWSGQHLGDPWLTGCTGAGEGLAVSDVAPIVWGGTQCGKAFVSIVHQSWVSQPIDVLARLSAEGALPAEVASLTSINGVYSERMRSDATITVFGNGRDVNGDAFAFESVIDLPEPGAFALIPCALVLGVLRKKRSPYPSGTDSES